MHESTGNETNAWAVSVGADADAEDTPLVRVVPAGMRGNKRATKDREHGVGACRNPCKNELWRARWARQRMVMTDDIDSRWLW